MAVGVPPALPAPRYVSLPTAVVALTGLATTSGVIHVVAMIEHVSVSWMFGLFFGLVGAGQLFAGWWIYHEPADRPMLKIFAAGSVFVSLLWILSRTTGLPFGPDAGEVAAVGVADTITTLQQLAFALIVFAIVSRPDEDERGPSWLRTRVVWLDSALGLRLTISFLSATLLIAAMGGHEH